MRVLLLLILFTLAGCISEGTPTQPSPRYAAVVGPLAETVADRNEFMGGQYPAEFVNAARSGDRQTMASIWNGGLRAQYLENLQNFDVPGGQMSAIFLSTARNDADTLDLFLTERTPPDE